MLNYSLSFLILILSAVSAHAQESEDPQFTAVYTDSSNRLSWSRKIPGTYTNGCVVPNDRYRREYFCGFEIIPGTGPQIKVDGSAAAKVCRDMGARLPTKSEYESLIRNFEHVRESNRYLLTPKGVADMQKVFGDTDQQTWFWTSSLNPSDDGYSLAYTFNGGFLQMEFRSKSSGSVRCVVSP